MNLGGPMRTSADPGVGVFGFCPRTPIWQAMVSSLADIRSNRRIMAYTAAAIYGIAGLDGAIEGLIPSDPPFSLLPVVVVFVVILVTKNSSVPTFRTAF